MQVNKMPPLVLPWLQRLLLIAGVVVFIYLVFTIDKVNFGVGEGGKGAEGVFRLGSFCFFSLVQYVIFRRFPLGPWVKRPQADYKHLDDSSSLREKTKD